MKGKKILNTHVAIAEWNHLRARAVEQADTATNVLRGLIRKDMARSAEEARAKEQAERDEAMAALRARIDRAEAEAARWKRWSGR